MPLAKNKEFNINYRIEGEGKPIVLLHSHLMDLQMWYEGGYVQHLSKNHKVIAMDIRGFGKSSKPYDSAAYEYEHLAKDVSVILDQQGIRKTCVFGYSMGGFIAFACLKYIILPVNTILDNFSISQIFNHIF